MTVVVNARIRQPPHPSVGTVTTRSQRANDQAHLLYINTVFVRVELLYRDGFKTKPQWPPLVGQLQSGFSKQAPVVNLWPLEWVANAPASHPPLATLWQPVLVRV